MEQLKKELIELYEDLDSFSHTTIRTRLKNVIEEIKKLESCELYVISDELKNTKLAFDMSCEMLANEDYYPCHQSTKKLSQCERCDYEFVSVKDCWKEYFLREVKEDE